jgi:type IV pilus assembly protein PilA
MLEKFREKRSEESGFTLVELLVVMLILGILAAIAIPAFFSQRDKGYDSDAKANARTVQTALETYAIENDGSYVGTTGNPVSGVAALTDIEGAISGMDDVAVTGGADTFTIVSTSDSDNTYTITRAATGATTQTCSGDGCSW